jgi:hypothetical protein
VYTGSNPVSTSEALSFARAISSVGERYLDTVEVTGSIPVSPTTFAQVRSGIWPGFSFAPLTTGPNREHIGSRLLHPMIGTCAVPKR